MVPIPSTPLRYGGFGLQSIQDALWREWNVTQAHSDGVENGVADCCRYRDNRRFAGAHRLHIWAVDQHDINGRDLRESENGVGLPVKALYYRGVELNFFQ